MNLKTGSQTLIIRIVKTIQEDEIFALDFFVQSILAGNCIGQSTKIHLIGLLEVVM